MTTAAASWLQAHDWADLAFVLVFEGVDLLFTTHSDVTGLRTAWAAATGNRWSTLRGGLLIGGELGADMTCFNAQVSPSSATFTIVDVDDALIGYMMSEAAAGTHQAILASSIDADDPVIPVTSTADAHTFSSTLASIWIGTEEIIANPQFVIGSQGAELSASFAVGQRGYRALFGTAHGGPSAGFGQAHNVDTTTGDKPGIADQPTHWVNRSVGLYVCHRVDGVWSAGLPGSSTNDAELLWSGRIKSWRDEGAGKIGISCIDVFDRLKTTLGATMFEGKLQPGLFVETYMTELRTAVTVYTETGIGSPHSVESTTYDHTTITQFVQPGGYVTHEEAAAWIQADLNHRFGTLSGTYGPAGSVLSLSRGQDGRYQLNFYWPGATSGDMAVAQLWIPLMFVQLLGFSDSIAGFGGQVVGAGQYTGTSFNSFLLGLEVTLERGDTFVSMVAANQPMSRFGRANPSDLSQTLITVTDVVNGTVFVPQDSVPGVFPSDTDGFLSIEPGGVLVAVHQISATEFEYREDVAKYFDEASNVGAVVGTVGSTGGDDKPATVRQVWLEVGPMGTIFLRLLASTGTAGYNHDTYDAYPAAMAAGIPWDLLDWQSILDMGSNPYLLLVPSPTPLLKLLESALNFGGKNLVFRGGKMTVVPTFGPPPAGMTGLPALTEANKARAIRTGGAMSPNPDHTTCDRNPDGIINRITLRYGMNAKGEPQRTVTINAVTSQSDNAGQVRAISLDAYGIYGEDFKLFVGSIDTWKTNVAAAALAYFGQAVAVVERSFDVSLVTLLYPGARVSLDDNYLVDPSTGTRGVTGLLCWCLSVRFDWSTGVGKVRLIFQPSRPTTLTSAGSRNAMWAPSAMVDHDTVCVD